jgi:hypothetical protein
LLFIKAAFIYVTPGADWPFWQLPRGCFVYKNSWHFKDIFIEIEAFVGILFEGIFREIGAFFK